MALALVGMGIALDMTSEGILLAKNCDALYLETYTNAFSQEDLEKIERQIGRNPVLLPREKVESSFLVDSAVAEDICLLSSGDPLTATTHISLMVEAKAKGVPIRAIHNSSIYSAAPARSGLQIYRFGKSATLVNARENYAPLSSLDVIRENLSRNLHSLVLLDTEPEPMGAKKALGMLSCFEEAIVLSRLGHADERILYGPIERLLEAEHGRHPFTIIIPAALHPVEAEYLGHFRI